MFSAVHRRGRRRPLTEAALALVAKVADDAPLLCGCEDSGLCGCD